LTEVPTAVAMTGPDAHSRRCVPARAGGSVGPSGAAAIIKGSGPLVRAAVVPVCTVRTHAS